MGSTQGRIPGEVIHHEAHGIQFGLGVGDGGRHIMANPGLGNLIKTGTGIVHCSDGKGVHACFSNIKGVRHCLARLALCIGRLFTGCRIHDLDAHGLFQWVAFVVVDRVDPAQGAVQFTGSVGSKNDVGHTTWRIAAGGLIGDAQGDGVGAVADYAYLGRFARGGVDSVQDALLVLGPCGKIQRARLAVKLHTLEIPP